MAAYGHRVNASGRAPFGKLMKAGDAV